MVPAHHRTQATNRQFVLLLLALALLLPLTGWLVVQLQGPQVEREAYANLSAIAKLKADQIDIWLQERHKDGQMLAGDADFARHVVRLLASSAMPEKAHAAVLQHFAQLRRSYQYESIGLLDLHERVLASSAAQMDTPLSAGARLQQVQDHGQVQRLGLRVDAQGQTQLSWLVPVFDTEGPQRAPIAAVILNFLPEKFLFPVIQTWPTSSPSGETLLVTRDGDMVVYLNTLRHQNGTAMKLRHPLSTPALPAAAALQSEQPGTALGVDHRGVAVLTAYRPVAGTDWRVVAKMDRAEVMAPVHVLARWVSAVTALALLALALVLGFFWRQHRRTQQQELLAEKNKADQLLERFYSLPFIGIAVGNLAQGSWGRFNDHFCAIVGCTSQQLRTLAWSDLVQASDWREDLNAYEQLMRGDIEVHAADRRLRRTDGTEVFVAMQLRVLAGENGAAPRCMMMLQDITRRHIAEGKIKRQSQLYAVLSACNQAIVQCHSQEPLFARICETAVSLGGLKMAWIGLTDQSAPGLRPVASFGTGATTLQPTLAQPNNNDNAFGRVSAATAVRENRPVWVQNFPGAPSSAAIPLHCFDRTIGVFVLMSDDSSAFDQDAQHLLLEMASDLDFALGNFEHEAQRQHTEQLLLKSQTQLELALKGSSDAPWDWDLVTQYLEYSPQGWRMLGYGVDDTPIVPSLWHALLHPQDMPLIDQLQQQLYRSGAPTTSMELRLRHKKGHYVRVLSRGFVTRDDSGWPVRVTGTNMDLTAQHQAQQIEALRPLALELIASNLDVAQIVQALVEKLSELLPSCRAASWLLDPSTADLSPRAVARGLGTLLEQARETAPAQFGVRMRALVRFDPEQSQALELTSNALREQFHALARGAGWIACRSVPVLSGAGRLLGVLDLHLRHQDAPDAYSCKLLDTVAQLVALAVEQRASEEQERLAAQVFAQSHESITITDADANILMVNPAFSSTTGYARAEVLGRNPRLLSSGRQDKGFYAQMWRSLTTQGSWQGEIWNRRKNGEVYPEWLNISQMKDARGEVTNYVAISADISARKTADDQIRNLAFYDPLTGLPNRRLLMDRLERAQASCYRHRHIGALLFVDLDNFKTINDTLGHHQGDLLLQEAARRLSTCVRDEDTVARLGGDEFVVLLENLDDNPSDAARQAETVGGKIQAALNQVYPLSGYDFHSTPSIGITLFGEGPHEGIDEPLKRADLAMYQAKAAGRNTLRFYNPQMQAVVTARAALEMGLREAVREQQFLLHYQTQVARNGQVVGMEALLRWQHPEHGIVLPEAFITLAEETGLIVPIGLWVLETAAAQLVAWAGQARTAHLSIAVNVSARQFSQPDFVQQVLSVLERTGANPHRLKLELTENLLVDNVEDVSAKMGALQARGVGFALDDFGAGYSSLSYLKCLPLDQLKIDQSFVRDLLTDPNDEIIARTIVALGHNLGLSVMAEGVETAGQLDLLVSMGCDAFQGCFFGHPVAVGVLAEILNENTAQPR